MSRFSIAVGIFISVVALGGCGADDTREVVKREPLPELLVVPEPPLDGLEEGIRQQIMASGAQPELLRESGVASRERLAGAYGEYGMRLLAYEYDSSAEAAFVNASRLAPESYRWWYYLGVTRRNRSDLEGAHQALQKALKYRPDDVPGLVSLAEVEIQRGALDSADALAVRALESDPRAAPALYLRGRVAAERGDHESAAARFEWALELQPLASIIRYPLATAYRGLGRVEEARAQLARRGTRTPALADPLMREVRELVLGTVSHLVNGSQAMRVDRVEVALREFRAARDSDPSNATARLNYGAVLARLGRYEEAIPELEEALTLDLSSGSRSKACFNLGVLYAMKGRVDEAREQFQAAMAWDPTNETARLHLERLEAISKDAP